MTQAIRINGVDVPVDTIQGPDSVSLWRAYKRSNASRQLSTPCLMQGSGSKFVGTPRHQKHGGGAYGGVRIK